MTEGARVLRKTPDSIHLFTDGACYGNGTAKAVGGYGVYFPHQEYDDIGEPFTYKPITNQRAELYAIYHALTITLNDEKIEDVFLYTDSDYSIKCITAWAPRWKKGKWTRKVGGPIKNLDLIRPIYRLYSLNRDRVHFIHVRSHTGLGDDWSVGNEHADTLAGNGCMSQLTEEQRKAVREAERARNRNRGKKRKRSKK